MKNRQKIKVVVIVLACVLLDIVMHVVTKSYSTMPENPNFSRLAKLLGTEITVSLWALISFSTSAYVYCLIRNIIPGEGIVKGLRYGSAIALLWLFAMLEGVSLFGNPVINEFVVGLSDAIPVFLMGLLLSMQKIEEQGNTVVKPVTFERKMVIVSIFSGIFLIGRYAAYFTGLIRSGYQTNSLYTFLWTLLMGSCIGVLCILLEKDGDTPSLECRAVKFGILIFGANWAVFLVFMPLLFSGYIVDVLTRIAIDIALVTIGYFLAFRLESNSSSVEISTFL